jgi:mannose-1-phosphate guanylyltransferase
LVEPADVWVCTTRALADQVRQQLPEVPAEQVLVEPEGRDTAPAIGWSLDRMKAGDDVVAVFPADHRVGDESSFRATLELASTLVRAKDRVMTLGVLPRWAEPGFGYLELGDVEDTSEGLRSVAAFKEKPDLETAERYLESGNYLWNAGIFVFRGGYVMELIAKHEPEISEGLARIREHPEELERHYRQLPKVSIDFAVMEKCRDLVTLPLDCEWSDLGSWAALAEILETDAEGNATRGRVVTLDTRDSLLIADEGSIAVVGISGLVVIRTGDAVLVVPKEKSQKIKELVDLLGRGEFADLL